MENDINSKKLNLVLEEYKMLKKEIIAHDNRSIQIISLFLAIYSVGFGYAIQQSKTEDVFYFIGDVFLFLPLVTFPLLLFYARDQIGLAVKSRYIEKEIENKKIPNIIDKINENSTVNSTEQWRCLRFQNYWNKAEFIKDESARKKILGNSLFFKSLQLSLIPIILVLLSALPLAFMMLGGLDGYKLIIIFPPLVYVIVPIFYAFLLFLTTPKFKYVMDALKFNMSEKDKKVKEVPANITKS